MLAHPMVEEIRRLLNDPDWSQRKIATKTGVSRGTISAISTGKRPDYKPHLRDEDEFWKPTGPKERCPSCGGTVYMPCRACDLRKEIASGVIKRCYDSSDSDYGPLQLDLHEEHRRAYEDVHAKREKAEMEKRVAELDDMTDSSE